jgi:hypothetical protein
MKDDIYSPPNSDLNQEQSSINIGKCKLHFKLLTLSWACFIIPLLLLILRVLPPPQEGGPSFLPFVMIIGGLGYYVFLGILASANKKSVIIWVGLSIITSPFSYFVSYPMMIGVGKKNKWL